MSERIGAVSDGAAEDLIRAFVQIGCAEGHTKTLLEKFNAELSNGIIDPMEEDVVKAQIYKINDTTEELDMLAELRRGIMRHLMDTYGADKDYWCMVKHIGVGAYNLFEAYQATGDATLLNLSLEANARFVKSITRFLGTEISDCAACLADAIKAKGEKINESTEL